MTLVRHIAAREWRAIVFSPTGAVVVGLYLVLAGYLFALNVAVTQEATLRYTLSSLGMLTVFTVPLISMRLLAEELRMGTFEVLIAHPVTDWQIVWGKFLAGWMVLATLAVPTLGYLLILAAFGSPDWGMALSGYLGLHLLATMLLALGLLISASTQSQVLAGMGTMIGGVLLWLSGTASASVGGWLGQALSYLDMFEHLSPFRRGVIDTRSLVYFVASTAMLLYLAVRAVESRRWKFGVAPEGGATRWKHPRASIALAVLAVLGAGEALLSRSTQGLWSAYNSTLFVAAVALALLVLWINRVRLRYELGRRRAGVALTVAANSLLVVSIWALAVFLASQHYVRLDLTRARHYALSEQTFSVLKQIAQPAEAVIVMSGPADLRQEIEDLLAEYQARSANVHVRRVDPYRNPGEIEGLRQRYKLTTPPADEILLSVGDQVRRLPLRSLFNQAVVARDNQMIAGPVQFVGEAEVTAALIQLTRRSPGRLAFVSGHGERDPTDTSERGASAVAGELKRNGWQVDRHVVTPGANLTFSADTGVVVIAGPQKGLADEDLRALGTFLDAGGGVLVLLDPGIDAGLEPLLHAWNVRLGNDLVIDLQEHTVAADPSSLYVSHFKDTNPIGKGMGTLSVVLPTARRIAVAGYGETNPAVFTSNFMHTSGNSWAVEFEPGKPFRLDPQRDRRGPVSLGIACERYGDRPEPGQPPLRGRLVVIGDSDFSCNQYSDLAGNLNLFLNCIDWLAGRQELISVRPKVTQVERIILTAGQAKLIYWLSMLVLPGLVITAGVLSAVSRRRKL